MEPKRVPIRVQHAIFARPQVGTTWGYWDRTYFGKDVRYIEAVGLGYDDGAPLGPILRIKDRAIRQGIRYSSLTLTCFGTKRSG